MAITLAEPSGSFVTRSELHFHGREMFRMSLRRHLYEVLAGWEPAELFPADGLCPGLPSGTVLGSYIGYADLRRHYKSSPVALALLGVPRKLSVDPDAHVITGNYGSLFGGPSLACTIYSMQDDKTAGAACAQACIIMVLGMLADRGGRLEGSYTLTQIGYSDEGKIPHDVELPETERVRIETDPDIECIFPAAHGLTPDRIQRALSSLGTSADVVWLNRPPYGARQEHDTRALEKLAMRMIECYVQARYPVILAVDARQWAQPALVLQEGGEEHVAHAVTVVGIRKASIQNRGDQLIVHDPARQPFLERPREFCFRACWAYNPADPAIVMVMPAEASVRRSLQSCLEYLSAQSRSLLNVFLHGESGLHPGSQFDYQFSLEYAKDVHTFLWPVALNSADRAALDRQLGLGGARYWCIAGYQDRELIMGWFFRADGHPDEGWHRRLFRNPAGAFYLRDEAGTPRPLTLPAALHEALSDPTV